MAWLFSTIALAAADSDGPGLGGLFGSAMGAMGSLLGGGAGTSASSADGRDGVVSSVLQAGSAEERRARAACRLAHGGLVYDLSQLAGATLSIEVAADVAEMMKSSKMMEKMPVRDAPRHHISMRSPCTRSPRLASA